MSTIKSSAENLTLNADGANNDIKFQSNGSEVAAIDQAGNLTVSGTVDGVDVAARDGVLTSTTATAAAALPKAGGTMTGNVIHNDNAKILIGTGSDLQIYHDASHSYISETGTGDLRIRGNGTGVYIQSNAAENMGTFTKDGAVDLYHNNVKKFETTAAGATVTGALAVTGTVDGVDIQTLNTTANAALPKAGGTLTGNTTIAVSASPTLKLKRTGNNAGNGNIECLGADDSVDYKIAFAQSNGVMSFDVGGTRMLGVTSSGLCFNSDTAAANTLADYEEGNFTPSGANLTSNSNKGYYIKIGKQVMVQGWISPSGGNSPTIIGGLPFTSAGTGNAQGGGTPIWVNANITGLYVGGNGTSFSLYGGSSRTDATPLASGNQMHFVLQYIAA